MKYAKKRPIIGTGTILVALDIVILVWIVSYLDWASKDTIRPKISTKLEMNGPSTMMNMSEPVRSVNGGEMGGMDMGDMDMGDMDKQSMQNMNKMDMTGGMTMFFHISYKSTILFEGWTTHNWQGMLWSCFVIFIMAALYEGLKVLREFLVQKFAVPNVYSVNGTQPVASSEDAVVEGLRKVSIGAKMCSISHLIQTILHVIQVMLSYFLMLIFMTYNFYLCVAVAFGAGAGYFFFSWKRATIIDVNEHCH